MDVQPGVIDRISDKDAYLARAKTAVDHAHANGIRVIQISGRLSLRARAAERVPTCAFAPMLVGAEATVMPLAENDIVVEKKRISAFAGNDLRSDPPRERHSPPRPLWHRDERRRSLDDARSRRQRLSAHDPIRSVRRWRWMPRSIACCSRKCCLGKRRSLPSRSGSRRPERQQHSPQRSQRKRKAAKEPDVIRNFIFCGFSFLRDLCVNRVEMFTNDIGTLCGLSLFFATFAVIAFDVLE